MKILPTKFLAATAALSAIGIAAAPAFAQQATGPVGPGYGYGPMWGWGWGWHGGMMFGPLMAVVIILFIFLCIGAMRWFGHGRFCPHCGHGHDRGHGRGALDILEERFARGEIDKNEFEEKRKLLGR